MEGRHTDALPESLGARLSSHAGRWGLSPRTRAHLLNISENATFRLDDTETAAPIVVRVHRPG